MKNNKIYLKILPKQPSQPQTQMVKKILDQLPWKNLGKVSDDLKIKFNYTLLFLQAIPLQATPGWNCQKIPSMPTLLGWTLAI